MELGAWRRLAISAASVGGAIVLWHLVSSSMARPELLPPPIEVVSAFVAMVMSGELPGAVQVSLTRVAIGYAAGVVAGIFTGLALGRIAALDSTVGIAFEFVKGIPPIALVPLVIIWFGIGEISKYIVIAYIVWIVVAISTAVGAREVHKVRLRTGAVLGLSALATFRRIILPSCLVYVVSGMRNAIGFAFVALVSAELIAANSGLGQIIMDARFSLQSARMIVGLLALGATGALIQLGFDLLIAKLNITARYR
jgi:ABC-type nitrate/sulfonate/bicarbonate transport system permease component